MQAIGNVNALPALIGDVICEPSDYLFHVVCEPSDCYFRCPVEPEAFPRPAPVADLGYLRRTRTARVPESADGRGLLARSRSGMIG
jgi:hypothetical protein